MNTEWVEKMEQREDKSEKENEDKEQGLMCTQTLEGREDRPGSTRAKRPGGELSHCICRATMAALAIQLILRLWMPYSFNRQTHA